MARQASILRCATSFLSVVGALLWLPQDGLAQDRPVPTLAGHVFDSTSGLPVEGVEVRLLGFATLATDADGRFAFPQVPEGGHVIRTSHVAYGSHEEHIQVTDGDNRVEIRISATAIELSPLVVETDVAARRPAGYQQNVITRADLARFEGTTMDLGDILAYQVPGIRVRRSTVLIGLPYCIEFRGATGGSFLRGRGTTDPGCNSPEVYLDGVLVANPSSLYPALPVETLDNIEVIPPSEAGSRFGTGALWGAIVIESRRPGRRWAGADVEGEAVGLGRFDWSLEPDAHAGRKVFFTALGANAAGVAIGLAVSNNCIRLRNPGFDSVVSDCSGGATLASALAGVVIPAFGAAAAARWAGDTDLSRGRFSAAAIGASIALVPGYAFMISSRRDGSTAAETMGAAMLLLGAPFAVTVADRLFRRFRSP